MFSARMCTKNQLSAYTYWPLISFVKRAKRLHVLIAAFLACLLSFCRPSQVSFRKNQAHGVISFSLYGTDPRYLDGAKANSLLYKYVYKGWNMRVYYDNTVPLYMIQELKIRGVELVNMTGSTVNKMSWRFLAISDPTVQRACIRDIDSRLILRDAVSVEAWIASGKDFHVIRDHPSHMRFAMSGGMWCARATVISNLESMLEQAKVGHDYLQDMNFLNSYVWPVAQKSVLQHDSFSCRKYGADGFVVPRVGMEHIGSVFLDGEMREADVVLLREAIQRGDGAECV